MKEAKSVRGIPDIVICYKGRFIAMELKKGEAQANRKTGRIVQQKHNLFKINSCGGIGYIVYPENLEEVFEDMLGS